MVREYKKKRTTAYTPEDQLNAVKEVKEGTLTLRKAHQKYKISLGTLSNQMKGKGKGYSNAGHPTVFSKETELLMAQHLASLGEWGYPFDILDVRMFAKQVLCEADRHVPQFSDNLPSKEWARLFLKRNKDTIKLRKCQNFTPSKAALSAEDVTTFFNNLLQSLAEGDENGVPPKNLFNCDEINLSDDPGTKMCVFKRSTKYPERIQSSSKAAVSLMFCGSASGQILPLYVVYKSEHLWTTQTEGGPQNTRYNRSNSGWFDANTFADWFEFTFIPHCRTLDGRKVILGDNLSSHFSKRVLELSEQNNLTFICLPPNSTHLLQPLDVAFFAPLKRKWRKILDAWKSSQRKQSQLLSKDAFPRLLKQLCDEVCPFHETNDNLKSGFKKCGIYPLNAQPVIARLPGGLTGPQTT